MNTRQFVELILGSDGKPRLIVHAGPEDRDAQLGLRVESLIDTGRELGTIVNRRVHAKVFSDVGERRIRFSELQLAQVQRRLQAEHPIQVAQRCCVVNHRVAQIDVRVHVPLVVRICRL